MTLRRKVGLGFVAALALAAAGATAWYRTPRPLRIPDYSLDLVLPAKEAVAAMPGAGPLRAGAGAVEITPDLSGPPVWMAGFDSGRRALGVHDPLWARALVLDDGRARVGIVALDLIGFFHDEVVLARRALPRDLGIDYLAVCSTHDHEGPDTMGLWGSRLLSSGV
ncbi:MAG TPA: hypothetical protein VHF22_09380, partial [Planctomycetota bacterium]|nr:hypothetical protein [Planctomycetota bacterium]